jgi:flagellar basal-body rod modification protein FlgD
MQLFSNPVAAISAAQPVRATADASGAAGSSSSSNSNSATVTANDFLELLVSEMKNQDPTANTDPNQYIDQLVQVNSLEQLIQINQDLTPASAATGATGGAVPVAGEADGASTSASPTFAPGNLSTPAGSGASSRIADALSTAGQTLAPGSGSSPLTSLLSSLKAHAQQAHTPVSNPAQ